MTPQAALDLGLGLQKMGQVHESVTLYLPHSDTLTRLARGHMPTYYKLSDVSFSNQAPGGVFTSHATKSHHHPLHLSLPF